MSETNDYTFLPEVSTNSFDDAEDAKKALETIDGHLKMLIIHTMPCALSAEINPSLPMQELEPPMQDLLNEDQAESDTKHFCQNIYKQLKLSLSYVSKCISNQAERICELENQNVRFKNDLQIEKRINKENGEYRDNLVDDVRCLLEKTKQLQHELQDSFEMFKEKDGILVKIQENNSKMSKRILEMEHTEKSLKATIAAIKENTEVNQSAIKKRHGEEIYQLQEEKKLLQFELNRYLEVLQEIGNMLLLNQEEYAVTKVLEIKNTEDQLKEASDCGVKKSDEIAQQEKNQQIRSELNGSFEILPQKVKALTVKIKELTKSNLELIHTEKQLRENIIALKRDAETKEFDLKTLHFADLCSLQESKMQLQHDLNKNMEILQEKERILEEVKVECANLKLKLEEPWNYRSNANSGVEEEKCNTLMHNPKKSNGTKDNVILSNELIHALQGLENEIKEQYLADQENQECGNENKIAEDDTESQCNLKENSGISKESMEVNEQRENDLNVVVHKSAGEDRIAVADDEIIARASREFVNKTLRAIRRVFYDAEGYQSQVHKFRGRYCARKYLKLIKNLDTFLAILDEIEILGFEEIRENKTKVLLYVKQLRCTLDYNASSY